VVSGLPLIAQSPLSISCTRTQVLGRIGSPSTETIGALLDHELFLVWRENAFDELDFDKRHVRLLENG